MTMNVIYACQYSVCMIYIMDGAILRAVIIILKVKLLIY
jgi:hypothetical protein